MAAGIFFSLFIVVVSRDRKQRSIWGLPPDFSGLGQLAEG
jgi:hypothetical protein